MVFQSDKEPEYRPFSSSKLPFYKRFNPFRRPIYTFRLLPPPNVNTSIQRRLYKKTSIRPAFERHAPFWRALPCTIGALIWTNQMIYFFFYFVTQPAEPDGSWSRIGPSYAVFPFISCVGAVRLVGFETVSISVAILLWTGFGIDYAVGSHSRVGIWWRRGKLFMASTSNVFLIALAFTSVDAHHKLHLIFTSFQIGCMGLCKACDWRLARAMRLWMPEDRYLKKSRYWKRIAAVVALPNSIIAIIGIYGCTARFESGHVVFTPVCWTLVSLAAPAEWILSCCWVIFLGTISYDSYHLDHTVEALSNATPPKSSKFRTKTFWQKWRWRIHSALNGQRLEQANEQGDAMIEIRSSAAANDASGCEAHVPETPPSFLIENFEMAQQRPGLSAVRAALGQIPTEYVREHAMRVEDSETELETEVDWHVPAMPQSVLERSGYQRI